MELHISQLSSPPIGICTVCLKHPPTTILSMSKETSTRLGFTDAVTLQVCTGCYLVGMAEILHKLGMDPKDNRPLEFWCAECSKNIPPPDVLFIGRRKVTATHKIESGSSHMLSVRAVKAAPSLG